MMSCLAAKDEFKKAETVVFWDMVECPIPGDSDVVEVSKNIREALRKLNYRGTTIYAYGDMDQIKAGLKSPGYEVIQHENKNEVTCPLPKFVDYRGTASIFAGETNHIPVADGHLKIVANQTTAGEGDAKLRRIITDFLCWTLDNRRPANFILILGSVSDCFVFPSVFMRLFMININVVLVQSDENASQSSPA